MAEIDGISRRGSVWLISLNCRVPTRRARAHSRYIIARVISSRSAPPRSRERYINISSDQPPDRSSSSGIVEVEEIIRDNRILSAFLRRDDGGGRFLLPRGFIAARKKILARKSAAELPWKNVQSFFFAFEIWVDRDGSRMKDRDESNNVLKLERWSLKTVPRQVDVSADRNH